MKNNYVHNSDGTTVINAKRHGKEFFVTIDTADFERVNEFPNTWFVYWNESSRTYYVVGVMRGERIYLHRWICGLERYDERQVDHSDGNGLNNRRSTNLKVCTRAEHVRLQRERKAVPIGDPNGLTTVLLSASSRKNADGTVSTYWAPAYAHGVYLGDNLDDADSRTKQWLALNIIGGFTDEQIMTYASFLGHDPKRIMDELTRLRTLYRRPNLDVASNDK